MKDASLLWNKLVTWGGLIAFLTLIMIFDVPSGRSQTVPEALVVLSHRVHKIVSTEGEGGDITDEWLQQTGVKRIEWQTFSTEPLHERIFREVSLKETNVDVAFLLNTKAFLRITTLFEPLDAYMQSDPIEDFEDIFPGMVQAMTFNGKLYGIPFRHSTSGLHYNEAIFAERGLSGPPRTIEEFVEYAKQLSFTRPDGTKVYGFIIQGPGMYPNTVDLARAWDGDFITPDYKVVANQPPMVKAISLLRELYEAEALPKAFTTVNSEDVNTWMQTGRAAMTIGGMGRNRIYNDPQKSKFPGQIKTVTIPISRELQQQYDVAPAKVEFWTMVIPRNAKNKKLSWSFIKHMASKKATLRAALNGNGPVRDSTYDDPSFSRKLPYAAEERRVLKVARIPLPPFEQSSKASDFFDEEAQAAILGFKTPQQAMDDLTEKVKKLLRQ